MSLLSPKYYSQWRLGEGAHADNIYYLYFVFYCNREFGTNKLVAIWRPDVRSEDENIDDTTVHFIPIIRIATCAHTRPMDGIFNTIFEFYGFSLEVLIILS